MTRRPARSIPETDCKGPGPAGPVQWDASWNPQGPRLQACADPDRQPGDGVSHGRPVATSAVTLTCTARLTEASRCTVIYSHPARKPTQFARSRQNSNSVQNCKY